MTLKMPSPLDYDFFFDWNSDHLRSGGSIGLFILIWGIVLTLIVVPVMVYLFGKRWYCSWVCGCGGLADTRGDPYRQHSNKNLNAWKIERWLIHMVLVFSLVMTLVTLYCYFTKSSYFLGINSQWIKDSYSLLIGAWFSGVIGTGFYPIFGKFEIENSDTDLDSYKKFSTCVVGEFCAETLGP